MENKSENWLNGASTIIETYRDLVTIKIVEQTSRGASISIFGIVLLIFVVFVMLFLGVGIAWWVGEALQNMKAGFFIVSGVYALFFVILLLSGKKYFVPGIRNLIIRLIYEED